MEWHFGYLPAGTAGLILSSAATRITLAATSEESYAWAYLYALTFAACLLLGAVHRIRLRPWHAEYTQGVKTFKITRSGVRSTGSLRIDRPMEEAQEVFLLGVATVESVKFDGRDGRMLHFRQGLSIRSWGEKFTAEFTEEGRGVSVKLTARPSVKTTVLDFDQGKIMIYEILSAVDAQNRLQGAISR